MVSEVVKITNKSGLHMRPANMFVTAMTKYKSDITIIFNEKTINAKSVMNIMAACIKCGSEIRLECDGSDEKEMLAEAVELIKSGFGE